MSSVRAEQRFTQSHPCPICGGYENAPRGQGIRCYGFLSDDGKWAHCSREEYAGSLEQNPKSEAYPHKLTGECRCGASHDLLARVSERNGRLGTGQIVDTYDYCDSEGNLLFQAVRFEPKKFKQRQPNSQGGYDWNLHGVERVPYRLPELTATDKGSRVYIPEGEKDVEKLRKAGMVATTNPEGAGKWRDQFSRYLEGREVVIIPDNDDQGRDHARKVAASAHGVAESVRIVELPELPQSGDLSDWFGTGNTVAELERLADEAPEWEPPPPEENNGSSPRRDGGYELTDVGNAERFVGAYQGRALWCPARKSWLLYDGKRWVWDERARVVKLAHETARSIHVDAAREPDEGKQKQIAKFALTSQNESRINAMLNQAKPYLAVSMHELDNDPWLINCENGTLDLRTGRLKDHDPGDLITRLAPVSYDPEATCPRFKEFLREILVEDEVVEFVKRYSGYTLTGITRERILAILYGFGKNGKTTLVEILQEAMSDYAQNTDTETLLMKTYQGVGNDVAALKGARFVSAAEVEKGRRLAESKVKQLTGRDTVTARFLFGEPFNFKPEFKLWLSTNNKPIIQGTDDAIWDRIRLIPFTQRFEGTDADSGLVERLREELGGIFTWMVEGCLEWAEHGLGEPEKVVEATEQYRSEMDTLAAFIEDRCVVHPDAVAPATPLYRQYRMWCDDAGEKPETQKMFGMRMRERGFVNDKITSGPYKSYKGWFGIGLRVDDPGPDDGGSGGNSSPPKSGEGPLGRGSVDDHPPEESSGFAGKTSEDNSAVDDGGLLNQNLPPNEPREEEDFKKRSTSSTSSTRHLTDEENERVRTLVDQGFSAAAAREEVLGEDSGEERF